jgi:thiol-disulfide isomerase/thioredoxin
MSTQTVGLAASLLFVAALGAPAQTLSIGDSPPPLSVSRWVKGERVDRFEPARTYVVDFWATWCIPCRVSIKHLTELQEKYKGRVQVLGVDIWEDDPKGSEALVNALAARMGYAVALDDIPAGKDGREGKTAVAWVKAAGVGGIPAVFIINDGRVAWIGDPGDIEEPLERILAGRWDLREAAARHSEKAAFDRKFVEIRRKVNDLLRDHEDGKAIAALDEAFAADPRLEPRLGPLKYAALTRGGAVAAAGYGNVLVGTVCKENASALHWLTWLIAHSEGPSEAASRDLQLALKAARRANDLTRGTDPIILDTLAWVHFETGDTSRALTLQTKAVALAGWDDPEMKGRLERYRQAVGVQDR